MKNRRHLVLAAAATLVLVVVLALDQRRLAREQDAVDDCRDAAAQADVLADRRLDATATYLSPSRVPNSDLAATLLSEAAVAAAGPVRRAAAECARTEVRAWHPGTGARLDNLSAYLDARLDALALVEDDGTRYYGDQPGDAELERLRERALPGAA